MGSTNNKHSNLYYFYGTFPNQVTVFRVKKMKPALKCCSCCLNGWHPGERHGCAHGIFSSLNKPRLLCTGRASTSGPKSFRPAARSPGETACVTVMLLMAILYSTDTQFGQWCLSALKQISGLGFSQEGDESVIHMSVFTKWCESFTFMDGSSKTIYSHCRSRSGQVKLFPKTFTPMQYFVTSLVRSLSLCQRNFK